MSELEKTIVASYAKALDKLSPEAKAELIELLSKPSNVGDKKKDDDFNASFGAWSDWDQTTEEIIADLRASRHFREKDLSF